MQILFVVILLLIFLAIIALVSPKVADTKNLVKSFEKPKSMFDMANPKKSKVKSYLKVLDSELKDMGKPDGLYTVIFVSIGSAFFGILISSLIGNMFLAPVLFVLGALLPPIYVRFEYIKYKHLLIEEMESTLLCVSSSYERCENIITAVKENLPYMQKPINAVFENFIYRLENLDPNVQNAIDDMKLKINNSVFWEWCDCLKRCQTNRNLRFTLKDIVEKLTEVKITIVKLKNILYAARRSFWSLVIVALLLLFIILFLPPIVFGLQIPTVINNILIAVNVTCVTIACVKVLIITNDIPTDI